MASKIGTGSRSCTVTQGWIYSQTGGSAGGSIPVSGRFGVTITQTWTWDGDQWNPNTPSAPSDYFYNDGTYSGWLSGGSSPSGTTSPPTSNGTFLGQTSPPRSGSGSAFYSGNPTKGDTRTYGWVTNGSQTNNAPPSIFYDDGTYYGNIPLVSISVAPSAPSGGGTVGQTTSTNTNGGSTANYSGTVYTDTTAPTISSFNASFSGATLNLSWSASDDRSWGNPAYRIYISDKNQQTYYLKNNFTSGTTSTSYTTDGQTVLFQNGYFYNIKLEAIDGAGNLSSTTRTVQYTKTPPVAPNTPTFSSITHNSVLASWNAVTNGDAYKVEYKRSVDSTWINNGTVTSTSSNIFGLSFSTTYNVRVTSLRNDDAGGYITGGTSSTGSFSTTAPPDTIPPELMVTNVNGNGTMTVTWQCSDEGVGMRAGTPYELLINSGGATPLVSKGFTTNSPYTFVKDGSGNNFVGDTTYQLQVKAYDANNNVATSTHNVTYIYVDRQAPTVNITSSNGTNTMVVSWSATDDIALKPTGTFRVKISGAGGDALSATLKATLPIGTTSYTFATDGNGARFVNNANYYIEIGATDTSNNEGFGSIVLKHVKTKPNAFAWSTVKTAGGGFNLTASEWNAFTQKINDVREYKNLTIYNFTNAVSGQPFTATIFNQAVSAITPMNPPTAPPTTKSTNQVILASYLNLLRDSLSSIN